MNNNIITPWPNQTSRLNQLNELQQTPPAAGARRSGPIQARSGMMQYLCGCSDTSNKPRLDLFGRLTCITNAVSGYYTYADSHVHSDTHRPSLRDWIEFEEGLQKWTALNPGINTLVARFIRNAKAHSSTDLNLNYFKLDWLLSSKGFTLTSLPAQIGNLTTLTSLNFSGNGLESLPVEIGDLTALTKLNLVGNRLESLPARIGDLTALTWLNLSDNQLESLPDGIGNLTALTWLGLNNNRLESLPDGIGNLRALTELSLKGNRLKSLPARIGDLTALIWLDLDENQLQSLPPMGSLRALFGWE